MTTLPRLVVAAPASGHGKTTIATGLMAALARTGLAVSGHKVGPDYIDPGYHALATGRPGRNLDPHLVGEDLLAPLLLHGARGADLAVVEGVMGLHDGQIGGDGFASTAHVARVTRTPVVLVVDISHASRSIGAVVQGMADFDDSVDIVGVILNKAGSQRHADEVRRAIKLPVLGVLHRDDGIVAPSRHLGLVPAQERDEAAASLDRLAERVAERIDLDQVLALARQAPALDAEPWDPAYALPSPAQATPGPVPVIAMAGGRAFTFRYAETEELLRAAGCDVVTFDPLHDAGLPPGTSGIYLGGGFPEVHAAGLSANAPLRHAIRTAVLDGVPTVAECAGLLYLCRDIDGAPMAGVLPTSARMSPRLTLSYRSVSSATETLLTRPGEVVNTHEFHRTTVSPGRGEVAAWGADGVEVGFAGPSLHASYLHVHWAGHSQLAQRFADAAREHGPLRDDGVVHSHQVTATDTSTGDLPAFDATDPLRHHGDVEAGEGLVDFAVNVFEGQRPDWLSDALHASLTETHHYPDATAAEAALARHHGRATADVLATAGAAEAFTLIARLRDWRHPVVVHPQFTEPDVALANAGHTPRHVLCRAEDDFALDPGTVPEEADLVVVGNPTNPTGVLHRAATIRALVRPGRLVVVDEAFMDGVGGQRESLAGAPVPGLVVVRSLTKLWAIPGVRAGYVLAEPEVITALRDGQVPWAVATTAAAAMVACTSAEADAEAARRAEQVVVRRRVLTDGLAELGIDHVASAAPFVLARPGEGVRERLRAEGFAVRRADTFPGLGPEWVRIAVRSPEATRRLLAALASAIR
ncbi:cobyrinate a,c-diamide synthase [Nocardioides sp. AE5]|nr:cobyrinate a,c-diamide synthase [Nocardioides sp. AE5]MDT0202201.1 cobyrinate a,c-diamide synthase [Nocardioides sp. AE5]